MYLNGARAGYVQDFVGGQVGVFGDDGQDPDTATLTGKSDSTVVDLSFQSSYERPEAMANDGDVHAGLLANEFDNGCKGSIKSRAGYSQWQMLVVGQ